MHRRCCFAASLKQGEHVQAEGHCFRDPLNSHRNLSRWMLITVTSRTFERLLVGDRAADDGEGCSGLESMPIRHCSCKLVAQCVFPRFDFLFHLQRQYPSIATAAHVRRTSFLADVQLVRKCFSNGTEALPSGRHLRVLSVEQQMRQKCLYLSILMLHLLFT